MKCRHVICVWVGFALTACEPTTTTYVVADAVGVEDGVRPDWYSDHVPAARHVDLNRLPLSDREATNLERDYEIVLDSQMFRYACTPEEIEALALVFAMRSIESEMATEGTLSWTGPQARAALELDTRFKAIAGERPNLSPSCAAVLQRLG